MSVVSRWREKLRFYLNSEALWKGRHTFRDRKVREWTRKRSYRYKKWRYYANTRREGDPLRAKWYASYEEATAQVKRWEALRKEASTWLKRRRSDVAYARRVIKRHSSDDHKWGGSRAVTNEVIGIVGGRHAVTSRKRDATYGNRDSDHHVSQKLADAVDFATANNYALAREIARKLGGSWSGDYDTFVIRRNGKLYRVQIIAGTHGTGPHLHVGVRRV